MRLALLFLSFLAFTALEGFAQSKGVAHFNFKASYVDAYMYRGHLYNDDSTLIGEAGIGMGKWSYQLLYADPTNDSAVVNLFGKEYTHEIAYTNVSGNKVITYGYHFNDYDGGQLPDTQEIFTRIAVNSPWNWTYGLAYDFDTYRGYYIDLSMARFMPLTERTQLVFNLRAAGSFELTEKTKGGRAGTILEPAFFEKDGLNHASAHLKFLWTPQKWIKLETGVDYHYAYDDLLYNDVTIERDNIVWRSSITLTLP